MADAAALLDVYAFTLRWTFVAVEMATRAAGILCLWLALLWLARRAVEQMLCTAALIEAVQEAQRQGRPLKWFHRWRRWGGRGD